MRPYVLFVSAVSTGNESVNTVLPAPSAAKHSISSNNVHSPAQCTRTCAAAKCTCTTIIDDINSTAAASPSGCVSARPIISLAALASSAPAGAQHGRLSTCGGGVRRRRLAAEYVTEFTELAGDEPQRSQRRLRHSWRCQRRWLLWRCRRKN